MMPKLELKRAQIHLTNRCNLFCKYCEVPAKFSNTKDLPYGKWIEVMDDLVDLKTKELTISGGGEPMLRFDLLIEILRITRDNGIKTGVITNGSLMNEDYARRIVEVQPDEWRTSICTSDKKTDAFLRGKDLSETSFKGISYLAKWKNKLDSELPKLEIWMLQTRYNITNIQEMIKKADILGANSLSLRMVNPPNGWLYPTENQRKELIKKLDYYKKFAQNFNIELRIHFTVDDILPSNREDNIELISTQTNGKQTKKLVAQDKTICMFPFHELVVFADGRVSPCCNFIAHEENSEAVESIKKKSLKEIWFSKKFNQFRKSMIEGEPPERCKECTPDFKCVNREYKNF